MRTKWAIPKTTYAGKHVCIQTQTCLRASKGKNRSMKYTKERVLKIMLQSQGDKGVRKKRICHRKGQM